jgi:sugar (pentulose or hexulose) kinase
MALYLGLDASTQGLDAIVVEIDGDIRRVVFHRTLNFDRDLPHYGTTGGLRRNGDGDLYASGVMWADALDRVLGRLAAAAEIEVERIRAIGGCAHGLDDGLHQHLPEDTALDPSVPLARQIRQASPIARRFDTLGAYFEALITGADQRLSPYWRKRFALPAASIVPWSREGSAAAIGMGIIRNSVIAVSFGTNDTVTTCASDWSSGASVIAFRNGALARELMRIEHGLDWDAVARLLEQMPGNDGCLMLPWFELEVTPPITHAGARRFGFNRHDAARNVRGLIEGQLMAMANHVQANRLTVERVIATGGAAANRAILQVMANVFASDVYRLDIEHSAALGAALNAYHADRLASGEPVSWKTVVGGFTDPKPGHRVSPNPRHVGIYRELRKDYALLERLHQHREPIC